jgi:hypothetical protein
MRFATLVYHTIFLSLVAKVCSAADCSCKQVTSWDDLRALILEANNEHDETPSSPPQNILLCPFYIQKEIDENTDHWAEFLNIKVPMNIVCKKERASDACWVEVVGEKCAFNENCGRAMIKVSSGEWTLPVR